MKLKYAAVVATVFAAATATSANANLLFDAYVGATGGAGGVSTFMDGDTHSDMAYSYGAVAGLDIPLVRAEVEYNYLNDRDITANIAMGNVYLKMPSLLIAPYIGAGVGAMFDGDAGHGTKMDTTAAYQGMLGVTFDVPVLPFKVDAEARALYAHDAITVGRDDADLLHYDIRAKLRYIF